VRSKRKWSASNGRELRARRRSVSMADRRAGAVGRQSLARGQSGRGMPHGHTEACRRR
jgi:hypothetical protein